MKRVAFRPKLLSPTLALLLVCGCAGSDESHKNAVVATMPVAVTGPITGGMGMPQSVTTAFVDLAANGYGQKEFFYEGDATAYAVQGEMTTDGKWELMETTKEYYKTRMLVRRPLDATKFNGTVVIEWLNVTGGADADPGFVYNWQELLRAGYVWVGVSAQVTGIEGGGFSLVQSDALVPLKKYDPERYDSLSHPGDAYSFDIYTRAAEIVRGAGEVDVLDGLKPKRLIAYGESQSAGRMVSYVNGVHPLVKVFDAFFIHSRGASGVPFGNEAGMMGFGGASALIRDDLEVKVFQFQTETDVLGSFASWRARQPDSDQLRTWEVAGTAHVDKYTLDLGGGADAAGVPCNTANDGPQHFVIKAALHALNLWMTDGTAPVVGEPLTTNDSGQPVTDDHGNVLGGVRTPDVDVPIATQSGLPLPGSFNFICFLFGYTTPFTPEKLMDLYPTHEDYVMKVKDAAREAREAKFLLQPEEQAMVDEAEAAPVPE